MNKKQCQDGFLQPHLDKNGMMALVWFVHSVSSKDTPFPVEHHQRSILPFNRLQDEEAVVKNEQHDDISAIMSPPDLAENHPPMDRL